VRVSAHKCLFPTCVKSFLFLNLNLNLTLYFSNSKSLLFATRVKFGHTPPRRRRWPILGAPPPHHPSGIVRGSARGTGTSAWRWSACQDLASMRGHYIPTPSLSERVSATLVAVVWGPCMDVPPLFSNNPPTHAHGLSLVKSGPAQKDERLKEPLVLNVYHYAL